LSEDPDKLAEALHLDWAFSAMVHFLALHWRSDASASNEVRAFIQSISDGEDGPATPEVFARFAEAAEDALRRGQVAAMRRP